MKKLRLQRERNHRARVRAGLAAANKVRAMERWGWPVVNGAWQDALGGRRFDEPGMMVE